MSAPVKPPAAGTSTADRVPWLTLAVSAVLTAVPVFAFLSGGVMRGIVAAVAAAAIAAYAAAVHPTSIFVAFALVLGAVPYMHVPGTSIPLLLVLAVGVWVALVFLPGVRFRPGWCELWVLILAATALLSVVATGPSKAALVEYAAWLAATAVVVPLRFLPVEARSRMVRTFTIATALGALVGILIRMDVLTESLTYLEHVGYDQERNVQYVFGEETTTTRLSGTFLEPNVAGLILAAGVLLAVAYFRGSARVALVVVIGSGLLLTLSRASLATLAVAGLLIMLRSPERRGRTMLVGLAAALAALAIPIVRARLVGSFGPSDTGAEARLAALSDFAGTMDGHWVWGLGWARPEFRSRSLGQIVNYVANAPLVTIYRGGIVLGLVVLVLLLVLVVRSWFAASRSFEDAVVAGGVIAFILVAMQLDFPIALQAPAIAVFSFLVAMSLTHVPEPPPPRSGRRTGA